MRGKTISRLTILRLGTVKTTHHFDELPDIDDRFACVALKPFHNSMVREGLTDFGWKRRVKLVEFMVELCKRKGIASLVNSVLPPSKTSLIRKNRALRGQS